MLNHTELERERVPFVKSMLIIDDNPDIIIRRAPMTMYFLKYLRIPILFWHCLNSNQTSMI